MKPLLDPLLGQRVGHGLCLPAQRTRHKTKDGLQPEADPREEIGGLNQLGSANRGIARGTTPFSRWRHIMFLGIHVQ